MTKYEHACLDIRVGNSRLIVCPGKFTTSLKDFSDVTAVVITHIHADHFDKEKINAITAANPGVKIYTTREVADELGDKAIVALPGKPAHVGDFTLEFFGKLHAEIDSNYPLAENVGVLANDTLYYPGDSFTICPKSYRLLAVPIHAPWLKFSETADFIRKSPAQKLFPTHNGFVNNDGNALYQRLLENVCQETSKTHFFIKPGESLEL